MGDECEKTCPLCAEEMDLTDRQLKPCKCGYEICVWCWHQIMDLAEKNESEGRCPACRTPYDKDKIVGMAANCERLVAEVNMEKKHKSQKAKSKNSENRKQLINVRVIQRNLVYIVGLPLNLADEDLLQGKEYFSRYGKVLKVSISRSAAGTIQQFPNDTCSVYITYSKEEEAIRCIKSVHGFILDGRPLRACFGTTKYCHAWLRNAPCNNPDCLYLHEIGSQEDSFTKDEIVSAYTRVQQITGVTNNLQQRSGSVLPSPADDHCNNSCAVIAKPVVKSSNNLTSCTRVSPPNSSSGKSGALPPAASWGARVSNGKPPTVSMTSSNGPTKQKADTTQGTPVHATISGSVPVNHCDVGKKQIQTEEAYGKETKKILENTGTVKEQSGLISMRNVSEGSCTTSGAPVKKSTNDSSCLAASARDLEGCKKQSSTHVLDGQPHSPSEDSRSCSHLDIQTSSICSDEQQKCEQHSDVIIPNGSSLNCFLQSTSQGLQWQASEKLQEHLSFATATSKTGTAIDGLTSLKETTDSRSDTQSLVTQNISSETEDDFNKQRLRDAIVVNQTTISTSSPLHILNHLRGPPHTDADCAASYTVYTPSVNRISDERLATNVCSASVSSNDFLDHFVNRTLDQGSSMLLKGGQENQTGRYNDEPRNFDSQPALDMGENNIISNILSLDLDSWDDSLTSPQNLAKLLCETDKSEGPINLAGSWKGQNSNQSRFSFARQEDSRNHLFDIEPALGYTGQAVNNSSFSQDFLGNGILYVDKIGNGFGFPHRNIDSSDNMISDHSLVPSSKLSRELLTASRSQISAPPGFSAPSRPPPPGFSSQRSDQSIDVSKSGNHLVETSSFFRNTYQASPNGNLSTNFETELFDPAILAVGEGRLPSGLNNSSLDMKSIFPLQISTYENNSRLQALMQNSLLPHQNLRYTNVRDSFSTPNDAYGYTSRHMDGSQVSNHVPFMQCSLQQPRNSVVSNGSLDGWNGLQVTNDVSMKDLPRSDRIGMSNFYGGYGDAKFVMTNTGDLYNRSFNM